MTSEITWLINGLLAHVTVHVSDETRSYSIAWLMGPDGEHCENRTALLGSVFTVGPNGIKFPNRASVSYDEALAFARDKLAPLWSPPLW